MDVMQLVDRLAEFPAVEQPFISLYVSTLPDPTGREHFEAPIKKELLARARTFRPHTSERASLDRDVERILGYLKQDVSPSTHGVAIFACAGAGDFFEAVQLPVPIERHELFVDRRPHLYPLARLHDQYRRYAAAVLDAHVARVFVFGFGQTQRREQLTAERPFARGAAGGWSQARYQRHVENFDVRHAREVVDTLERAVREERITEIVLAGDEPMLSTLRQALPKSLAAHVIDAVNLDANAPEHEVFRTTLGAVRVQDAVTDAEKVERLVDEYRSGGLAVVGLDDVLAALGRGQADEVLLAGQRELIQRDNGDPAPEMADELVSRARQTGAKIAIIEDPALLADVGGVGARLRYRIGVRRVA